MNLKDKTLAAVISFLTLFVLIGAFVLAPMVYEMSTIGLKIGERDRQISDMDNRIEKTKAFRAYFSKNEQEFGKLDELLVNQDMPLNFISFLEGAAKEADIAATFSPSASARLSKDSWPSINFEINVSGSFTAVSRYVKKLEAGPYLTEIRSLNIKKEEAETQPGEPVLANVKAVILLKVYTKGS